VNVLHETQVADLVLHQSRFGQVGLFQIVRFDTAHVVRHLSAQILHESVDGDFELASGRSGTPESGPTWISLNKTRRFTTGEMTATHQKNTFGEQFLQNWVIAAVHGLSQIAEEQIVVLVHESGHGVRH